METVSKVSCVLAHSNGCYGTKHELLWKWFPWQQLMAPLATITMKQIHSNQLLATIAVVLLWKVL